MREQGKIIEARPAIERIEARLRVRILGSALAIVLGVGAAGAQESAAPRLTLEDAAATALRENPSMRRAQAGLDEAKAHLAEAGAGQLPRVVIAERFTNGNNPAYVFGALLEQGRLGAESFALDAINSPDPLTNFRSSVEVTAPIFDQHQTRTRVERARLGVEGAEAVRELARQRLGFEVLRAYCGVLLAEAGQDVVAEAVASAEADLDRVTALYQSGQVVASEQLAVEVQLAEYRQQRIQIEGDVATAYAALNTALGAPVETPRHLATPMPEHDLEVAPLDELTKAALATRPDYRECELDLRSREAAIRGAKGEYLPRADAFASTGLSSRSLVDGRADYTVGVSVTFTVFDAGREARVDRARAARETAAAEREELADAIRLEVARAYHDFTAARERLSVASSAIAHADETFRIVRARHQAGLTTITEVLRAHTALVRARMNLVSARYLHAVGYGQVLLATGRLADLGQFTR
jgi:outer membrane protein TolC